MYVNNDGDNDDDDNDDNDDCGALSTSHTLTRGERDPCTLPIFLYRPTGEAGGVFDAAHTFLGEYRTRTHTPRLAGVGNFLLWLTSPTNEILVGISDFFSLRAHDSHLLIRDDKDGCGRAS